MSYDDDDNGYERLTVIVENGSSYDFSKHYDEIFERGFRSGYSTCACDLCEIILNGDSNTLEDEKYDTFNITKEFKKEILSWYFKNIDKLEPKDN